MRNTQSVGPSQFRGRGVPCWSKSECNLTNLIRQSLKAPRCGGVIMTPGTGLPRRPPDMRHFCYWRTGSPNQDGGWETEPPSAEAALPRPPANMRYFCYWRTGFPTRDRGWGTEPQPAEAPQCRNGDHCQGTPSCPNWKLRKGCASTTAG
jgi:hypothetical protein